MSAPAPLRGALVGCGYVARHHLAAWRLNNEARIVGLCDLRPERLTWASGFFPDARLVTDAAQLFDLGPLDFIEVCTRPDSHRPLTELAASRGTHVLCQKPAAETREDLLAMIAACDGAGVRLMIHENWRFRPWHRVLRSAIDAGAVGRPIRLRLAHRDTRALRPGGFDDQPYFAAMPRLMLFEMGPHLIDTARYLMGEVASVAATLGRFAGHAGEDLAVLSLQFESGALGLLEMAWCVAADVARPEWAINQTVVEGTEAALRLRTDGSIDREDIHGRVERIDVPLPEPDRVYLDAYAATQAHFLDGLRTGVPHETSGAETLKTMDVIWAGYRSAEEERTIALGTSPV